MGTQALVTVLFQVFYTSVFGMYVNFLLIRTGSTIAVSLTHSFCNHQGFPDLSVLVSDGHDLRKYRAVLTLIYVAGLVTFTFVLNTATQGFHSNFVEVGHTPVSN